MIPEDYYVYVLLDTRTSGDFIYDNIKFEYKPFYVGKGRGSRISQSKSNKIKRVKNIEKQKLIEKIHSEDMEVKSIKYLIDLTESDSFVKESLLIRKIGRLDKGNGPLTNRSYGGEGQAGGTSRLGDWPELYKRVLKYSLNGILLQEYQSIKEAKLLNTGAKNITYCCQGKRDTSGGFIWKYKDVKNPNDENIDTTRILDRSHTGNFPVPVIQKNHKGEIIKEYLSIKQAANETGCSSSKIVLVCKGQRKHTKGFIFEYK